MSRYQLRLRYAASRYGRLLAPQLTPEVVAEVLPAVGTPSITPLIDGYEVSVDIARRDHAQAMVDMASTFEQLELTVLQATIIETGSSWLEGGAIGTLGGAVLAAATKSVEGFVGLVLAGVVLGALRETEKEYVAALTPNGWEVTRREPPATGTAEAAF